MAIVLSGVYHPQIHSHNQVDITSMIERMCPSSPVSCCQTQRFGFAAANATPYYDETLQIGVSVEGIIWNLPDLKRELILRGYPQCGSSAEEILCCGFARYGTDLFSMLRGGFAIAVYDGKEHACYLARDRFGICSVFYTQLKKSFLFASEIKAFFAVDGFYGHLNAESLCALLSIGPARPAGNAVFAGVSEVIPAHYVRLDSLGAHDFCYYLPAAQPFSDSPFEASEKVYQLLFDSVKRCLSVHPNTGAMLSGGLDSTVCCALAMKQQGRLNTYSVDYEGNDTSFVATDYQPNSDTDYYWKAAEALKTNHRNTTLSREALLASLPGAMRMRDLPGMGSVDGSLSLFCSEIKKTSQGVLTGECSDEFFLGYPWFHRPELISLDTFPFCNSAPLRRSVLAKQLSWLPLEEYTQQLYRNECAQAPAHFEDETEQRLHVLAYLTTRFFMQNLMERAGRIAKAYDLILLLPFCDEDLYDYLWSMPQEIKLTGGQPKGILRTAMAGVVPDIVLNRKKSPYPKTHDQQYAAMVKQELQRLLPTSPLQEIFDADALLSAVEKGTDAPWFGQLMCGTQLAEYAIQMHYWLREYVRDISIH